MTKKPKSEAAEVARRVEQVLRLRLDGAQFHDVVQYAAENGWGLRERQVRTYIRRADDLLAERQDNSRRRAIARHVARREALFARALAAADYRTALAVLADLAKLRGLYHETEFRKLAELAEARGLRIAELEQQAGGRRRSEEHTSELQSQSNLVCRLLLEKKKTTTRTRTAAS